jgi:Tfp pilus assembly protein PilO
METPTKKRDLKASLVERMHDPLQLRAALCVALLAAWYFLGYTTMRDRIATTTSQLERDRKRLALATEVEALREEAAEFADRLPPRSDPNEFLQYILGGVRSGPLKLVSLNPEKPKDAGPYEVATVRIELEGKYQDVDTFLRWVENDKRLLRIDGVKVDPDSRDSDILKVQLIVLGLMGVEEGAKEATKKAPSKGALPKSNPTAKKPAGSS